MRATLLLPVAIAMSAMSLSAQEQFTRLVTSPVAGPVEVVNVAGTVRVTGWSRSEIEVRGTVGRSVERVAVESANGRTEIRVVIPQGGGNVCNRGACSADLEIRMPLRKDLTVRTTSADVQIAGITGSVSGTSTSGSVAISGSPRRIIAESTSGELQISASTSTVRATTTSGGIQIGGSAQSSVAAESVSGDVHVQATTPELTAGTVSGNLTVASVGRRATVSTVSGDATVSGSRIQYLSFESVSGTLRFDGEPQGNVNFDIESHSGDIELRLPSNIAADFEVSTFSGAISNGLGPSAQRTSRYAPGQELRFATGSSGSISVRTFSGTVRLVKR